VFSVNMVHLVNNPLSMLGKIQRILKPEGYLFIKDLRKSWLGMFEKEINNAFTLNQAKKLIDDSELRKGYFSNGFIWWNFEA